MSSILRFPSEIRYQPIDLSLFDLDSSVSLVLKREDEIHPYISGNKFRKLKYNIEAAQAEGDKQLLTFGGAFSNHIAAVAAAGKQIGLATVGIIRGEELASKIAGNDTLQYALNCGMSLHYVTREAYRRKELADFLSELKDQFGEFYLLPEGGTNALAVKGCAEILSEADASYDIICAPVGTGGTLAGLAEGAQEQQKIIGYSALKGTFQLREVVKYSQNRNVHIVDDYCFGGYAKVNEQLVRFMNNFKAKTGIPLDPVYTAKMMYGILEGIKNGDFKQNSRILAIHTGGLQGIAGMNKRLLKKQLPHIE